MLLDWVKDAEVRLREEGHVYFGEAFVVPVDDQDLVERLQRANRHLLDLDWRCTSWSSLRSARSSGPSRPQTSTEPWTRD